MQKQDIASIILASFADAEVITSGADCNFQVTVVSSHFQGMMPVKRQQAVLGLFAEQLKSGELHALSVKAQTPSEYGASSGLTSIDL
ncbi:MAG: BolA/IbaG family iron-sulfur metabolism protein [Pseudomonadota bacterium]